MRSSSGIVPVEHVASLNADNPLDWLDHSYRTYKYHKRENVLLRVKSFSHSTPRLRILVLCNCRMPDSLHDTHDARDDFQSAPPSIAKLRWWIFCFVSAIVISPLVSVLLGFHLHARDFQTIDVLTHEFTGRVVSCLAT